MAMPRRFPAAAFLIVLLAPVLSAQEILLDRTLRVASVTLFASRTHPGDWYYLPDRPHVASDREGRPEFSFVKYVLPERSGGGREGITTAAGGGVVHLLASYELPEDAVAAAQAALNELEGHERDRIVGPVLYRDGTFELVSTMAGPESGMARRVLGTGRAPLIEGERAAVSLELSREGAALLWRALDMEHPDLTLVFSMQVAGYRTPYEAQMVVDWNRLWQHHQVKAGVKLYWVGLDVDALVDTLLQDGTIQVSVKGESAPMDALLTAAYTRAVRLLFEQAPSAEAAGAETSPGGTLERILSAVGSAAHRYTPVDLTARYRLRHVQRSGRSRFSLRQQTEQPLFVLLTADIGPVTARHRHDPRFFKVINLEDPAFRQREVSLTYDGDARSFAEVLNHVVVQLRKRHGDGSVTLREAVLEPGRIAGEQGRLVFTYPNSGDGDLERWLHYQWRAVWSFREGFDYDGGWQDSDAFAIALRPPFVVRRLSLEGDETVLRRAGVRAVTATLEWNVLGHRQRRVVTVRPGRLPRTITLLLSRTAPAVEVTLTWHVAGGRKLTAGPWGENSDIVFVDEMPEPPATETTPALNGGS